MDEEAKWIDFQSIKDSADVERVLDHCGILEHLERRGAELFGWCPLGKEHGKGDSFAFNVAKKSFQCFACKARGSILDFVRKYDESDLRTAAARVQEIMAEVVAPSSRPALDSRTRPYGKKDQAQAKNSHGPLVRNTPFGLLTWEEAFELVRKGSLDPENLAVIHPISAPSSTT